MSAHKWWRVINITVRTAAYPVRSAAELRFVNNEGVDSNIPSKGFSESIFGAGYEAGSAFDSNSQTMAHSAPNGISNQQGYLYYIGYEFDAPVTVTSISVQMRQDMQPDFGQEWQQATIEYSDDGVIWFNSGFIQPNIAPMDLSLVTVPIISVALISLFFTKSALHLNIYTTDESGSISGVVQEKGLPIRAEVALHDRLTRKIIAIAWSDSEGAYSFNGLDKNREYYAEALHPTRKFNLVGQDGLKSGMTA